CLDKEIFEIEGIYTHFATADELNTSYFQQQYDTFCMMLDWVKEKGIHPEKIHCANSATILRGVPQVFNTVRAGIATYGLTPSIEMASLIPVCQKPAFSLHSRISHVKKIQKSDAISYGATYHAQSDEWIATIPIGYADGWIRKLQGFSVLVCGEKVPIVGRICMDQCMVKLKENVPIGTKVTLIGVQGDEEVTVEEVASYTDTINYEVICTISARVPRVYIRNGEVVEVENRLLP